MQWDCCLFWWIHQQWQGALHGYEGTYLIFYSLVSLSEGFTSCAQILPVGTVGKENRQQRWESLLSPLCPSTLGSGRHKPFIPWWGQQKGQWTLTHLSKITETCQKKELSQETWQVIPSLGVLVTHWQESPTGHSWGWQEMNHLLQNGAPLLSLPFSICF